MYWLYLSEIMQPPEINILDRLGANISHVVRIRNHFERMVVRLVNTKLPL